MHQECVSNFTKSGQQRNPDGTTFLTVCSHNHFNLSLRLHTRVARSRWTKNDKLHIKISQIASKMPNKHLV